MNTTTYLAVTSAVILSSLLTTTLFVVLLMDRTQKALKTFSDSVHASFDKVIRTS